MRPLLVIAVDGVLVDTLPLRAQAWDEARRDVGLHIASPTPPHALAGVDWRQLARTITPSGDHTLRDLLVLAAERTFTRHIATAAPALHLEAVQRVRDAAESGWRVVLRADSTRRAAGALLDVLAEQTLATRVIAADDVRPDDDQSVLDAQRALVTASYAAVMRHDVEFGAIDTLSALPTPPRSR